MSKKLLFFLIIPLFFLIWLSRWWWLIRSRGVESGVVFCDVGQGDATLIVQREWQMLVDGGPDSSVLRCLKRHMPAFDEVIDVVLLTHADSDHFAGLTSVLRHYQVKRLIINNVAKDSMDFWAFYEQVEREIDHDLMQVQFVNFGDNFCLTDQVCMKVVSDFKPVLAEDVFHNRKSAAQLWDIIAKFVPKSYNYNDGSIVIILNFDGKNFILTGDAEQPAELAMLAGGLLTDVDVLKVGHHGSKSSTSDEFVRILRPESAVISCGEGNSYGHPHPVTLETLARYGVEVRRTDRQGEIFYEKTETGEWEWHEELETPQ
ncbi:MBL fold metallo-hydrolase [bacterium]|nr:MBL fold metallo-hydrolase [bacterium]